MIALDVDVSHALTTVAGIEARSADVRPALVSFHAFMSQQTEAQFSIAGRSAQSGGSYRGVTWSGLASQYRRKDGTIVPAWGGIRYANRKRRGLVKGRKRPSGKRVTRNSRIMRDTGQMAAEATRLHTINSSSGNAELIIYVEKPYAKRQQELRRFLFFSAPKELDVAVGLVTDYIMGTSTTQVPGFPARRLFNIQKTQQAAMAAVRRR